MKRASQSVALVLISSASILQGCGDAPDSSSGDFGPGQPTTRPSYTSHSSSSHWYYGRSHFWGSSGSWNSSSRGSSGSGFSSAGSASHGTSRGGFGSTGHSASHGGS